MKKKLILAVVLILAVTTLLFSIALFAESEEPAPVMSIDYNNLSFRDNICVKYAVALENAPGATLLVWETPQESYTYGTQTEELQTVGTQVINEKTYYIFDYTGLAAKQMTDQIYARAYVEVGGEPYYSEIKKYSVLEYALTVLGKIGNGEGATDDPAFAALMSNMLAYGAAAQEYMNYATDRLATAEYGQLILDGGSLPDGFASGLYPAGTSVTLSAPATDSAGKHFSHWVDQNGKKYGTSSTCLVTVSAGTFRYSPVYAEAKEVEYFYTDAMVEQLKSYVANNPDYFSPYVDSVATFALTNTDFVSNGKIVSLGLPVYKTTTADADGNYILTLQVFGKDAAVGLKSASIRSYSILVNGAELGLTDNMSTMKWIDLDLSEYNICLEADETIGFFKAGDTLYPAYTNHATVKSYISGAKSDCIGFYMNVGKSNASSGTHALILNLGMERADLSVDPYYYESSYTASMINQIRSVMESNASYFPAYAPSVASFAMKATDFVSDGHLVSVGLPVKQTLTADENGNYTLTIGVYDKDLEAGMTVSARRTYTVLINRDKYGLTDQTTALKWIDIDLTDYNIVLGKNETLAFFSSADTLYPAYATKNAIASLGIPSDYVGFYRNIGKSSIASDANNALVLDLRMERENTASDPYVIESFYPDALVSELKTHVQSNPSYFTAFADGLAPFMLQAEEFVSDGTLTSLGFPVFKTGAADTDGNYTLSIFVYGKDLTTGLKAAPRRSYTILVNGTEYGLTDNMTTVTWIELDLSDYGITLAKDETLAFYESGDTLCPSYTNNATLKSLIDSHTDAAGGFIYGLGTSTLTYGVHTLVLNVGMERPYTEHSATYAEILAERAAYEQLLSQLTALYAGKNVSVIGDSISTFAGYSNNTSYNSTIGSNAVYYQTNGRLSAADHTYWMQVIDALDMNLCVNNSWSGGRVFGKSSDSYADSAVNRSVQLHNNDGAAPDVILYYMGINDINNNVTFGNLLTKLSDDNTREENLAIVDTWFKEVLARNAEPVGGSTYTTFQEAYALSLYRMKTTYSNAEIYCLNLLPCVKYFNSNGGTLDTMEDYNYFYELMVDYFDLTLVDQYHESYMDYDTNLQFYTDNNDLLHPNAGGHSKMAELILRTMGKKNNLG